MRSRLAWWPVVAATLVMTACAGIPTSGPVQAGSVDAQPVPPISFIADAPQPDDDPATIVNGFITASSAGVAEDFTVAREYLTPGASADWDPSAQVVVVGAGEVNVDTEGDGGAVSYTYSLPVAATLDSAGRMTEMPPGSRRTLEFDLVQDTSGQWRIAGLEDGVVVVEPSFTSLYRPVSLAFASPDGHVTVPELRWLPVRNVASHASLALLEGPSPWLAHAVQTGVPDSATLELGSVPIVNGEARVALDLGTTTAAGALSLIESQFRATLVGIPEVGSVAVTVGGLPIGGDGSRVLEPAPVPDAEALVVVAGRLGFWDGEGVEALAAPDAALPDGASAPAVSYDGARAAFLLEDGAVGVATLAGERVPLGEAEGDRTLRFQRVDLGAPGVAPGFDRAGWLWSAEIDNPGALVAMGPAGQRATIAVPWLAGREVQAVRVARDGVRVAVLSRVGGQTVVEVAAIVRTEEGAPLSVGDPVGLGAGIGPSRSLAWVDAETLAVLGVAEQGEAPLLYLVTVGGRTVVVSAVVDAVDIAARNGERSLVLVTRQGVMYVRSSSGWSGLDLGLGADVSGIAYAG